MISEKSLKGVQGETLIMSRLQTLQKKYDFEFIYDFPVKKKNGSFLQCDFVVLSTRGYFVLEVKNWQGVLDCDGCANCWHIAVGGRVIRILNPVLQNSSHVRWLFTEFGIQFQNILLFADTCALNHAPSGVYNFCELEGLFRLSPVCISHADVSRDYQTLSQFKADNALRAIAERFVNLY